MTLSRKERDELRRQREILDASLSIFAQNGYHGTTMADISRESQYPLGTIYKYFPGKKQIFYELVMERVHHLGQQLYEISCNKDLTPPDALRAFLFAKARFYIENSDFIRIYISQRSTIDAVVLPQLNDRVNRMHDKMVTLFEQTFKKGIPHWFKPHPPRQMALMFTDMAHFAAWAALFREEDEMERHRRLELVFDIFLNGVTPTPHHEEK